jgi:hypothetical protein
MKDAQVFIMSSNYDSESSVILTSNDGTFVVTSYLIPRETISWIFGEKCYEKPELIRILIKKEGYKTLDKVVKDKEFDYQEERGQKIILLPQITISEGSGIVVEK